jgi:hypothetical protein
MKTKKIILISILAMSIMACSKNEIDNYKESKISNTPELSTTCKFLTDDNIRDIGNMHNEILGEMLDQFDLQSDDYQTHAEYIG